MRHGPVLRATTAAQPIDYLAFVKAKIITLPPVGLPIAANDIHGILKPHQAQLVHWAVEGGRRAIFAAFGLGKSLIQLEIMRQIGVQLGGRQLIVVPLTVLIEFKRDAALLGMAPVFIRSTSEIASLDMLRDQRGADRSTLYLTNYESVRDGKIDLSMFNAASLDEASCLRGFGGTKTFREFMRLFDGMRYKFVATATPSPNDYIELLAYAAFLEIMDVGQAKTRFFKRNSEKADELTIHPHKEDEFWLWVNSWAAFVQRPSDLGFSDEGYELPDIDVRWHEVASDHSAAGEDKGGQGLLLKKDAIGVVDAAREKRATIDSRVAKMVEIVTDERSRQAQGLSEGLLREEPREAAGEAARARQVQLCGEAGSLCVALQGVAAGEPRKIQVAAAAVSSGECSNDQCAEQGLVSGQQGPCSCSDPTAQTCAIRPDRRGLSGDGDRAERSVCDLQGATEDPSALCGSLPCDGNRARTAMQHLQCRHRDAGRQSGPVGDRDGLSRQQWVVWCDLNDEQRAADRAFAQIGLSVASIDGSTSLDERVRRLEEWRDYRRDVILSKPVVLGSGMNLQQCNRAIFLGIGFKFNDFYQAVHRIQRFLQTRRVVIDLIYSEAERAVRRTLEAKWQRHRVMMQRMSEIIRQFGLGLTGARDVLARTITSGAAAECAQGPDWTVWEGDTVIQTAQMASDSVGLIVTSVPFGTQYEYSPSYNDFGHTDDSAHFFAQMDYLTPELLRVLQPGRRMAVHVKDRVVPSGMTGLGFRTIEPFHARCIDHYIGHGFAYLGMVTIVTDVVRENAGTYRLGWTEQCKDASGMGVGLPEYLLLFRKPPTDRSNGYADVPVVKGKPLMERVADDEGEPDAAWQEAEPWDDPAIRAMKARPVPGTGYSRARWQTDAAGLWRSNGNRTLLPDDLAGLPWDTVYQRVRAWSWATVYDHEGHVALMEAMEARWALPTDFALMPVQSWHPEVWTDVARMYGANTLQSAKGREQHLCPLPFDIVDRAILNWSNAGDVVYDPFGGLMTVPLRAVKHGRKGAASELNPGYFADGVSLLREQDAGRATGDLFDLLKDVGEAA